VAGSVRLAVAARRSHHGSLAGIVVVSGVVHVLSGRWAEVPFSILTNQILLAPHTEMKVRMQAFTTYPDLVPFTMHVLPTKSNLFLRTDIDVFTMVIVQEIQNGGGEGLFPAGWGGWRTVLGFELIGRSSMSIYGNNCLITSILLPWIRPDRLHNAPRHPLRLQLSRPSGSRVLPPTRTD